MTDLKPEDLVKLRERLAKVGVEQGYILPAGLAWMPASFEALLADRARMEKALREADALFVQAHDALESGRETLRGATTTDERWGVYIKICEALNAVRSRQALGASPDGK